MDFENTGSSDYVSYGGPSQYDLGTQFTIMGWVKPETLTTSAVIFTKSVLFHIDPAISFWLGTSTNGHLFAVGTTYVVVFL